MWFSENNGHISTTNIMIETVICIANIKWMAYMIYVRFWELKKKQEKKKGEQGYWRNYGNPR